ncbi:MAG: hypothetical protein HUK02_02165 [Bacteroidaceae bacterium]|nr:hypothetical protein [Bacteroidaceae bacterium]
MKLNIFKWMPALCIIGVVALTASCADEPDKYKIADGSPTVRYVRPLAPESADSLLTGAYLDEQICLVGSNLRSIVEMYFNDQKAILNTALITDNTLIVSVPGDIPVTVTDKIYMVNKDKDTIAYDFKAIIPAPLVAGMKNEWVRPGEHGVITGNYFVNDENVPLSLRINGVPVQIDSYDQYSIHFTMPQGITEGPVQVTSLYGTTKSKFNYHDTRNTLFNDWGTGDAGSKSTGLTNHGWHTMKLMSDDTSLDGTYLYLGGPDKTMSPDGAWDDSAYSFEYWPGDWNGGYNGTDKCLSDLFPANDWERMAIKFEMCIPSSNPWQAGAMQIIFSSLAQVSCNGGSSNQSPDPNNLFFNSTNADCKFPELPRALYRPWVTADNQSYDTADEWITVTVPFTDFKYRSDGTEAKGTLNPNHFTGLTIFVWSGGINGAECHPIFKIDNIRCAYVN